MDKLCCIEVLNRTKAMMWQNGIDEKTTHQILKEVAREFSYENYESWAADEIYKDILITCSL